MKFLIITLILFLANNASSDYDEAINLLNKRYIKESLLEFSKVARDSEDLKKLMKCMEI